jgi:O-antigen ligase
VNIFSINRHGKFIFLTGLFLLSLAGTVFSEQFYLIAIPFLVLLFIAGWSDISRIYLLLMASIPWSVEYSFSRELATDIPDEFLMVLVSFLFFAGYLYKPSLVPRHTWRHPLMIFLFIHLLWLTIAVCFTSSILVSVKQLLAKSWYVGAFVLAPLIVFREKKFIIKTAVVLAISMFIVACVILVHHAFYAFRFADMNKAVFPFFRNHVNYSALLVCVIPLFFAFYRLSHSGKPKQLIIIAIIILLVALFFTYARGAWVALGAGLAAYWLIRKKLMLFSFIMAIILLVAGLFIIKSNNRYLQYAHDYKTTIYHKDFREHIVATYKLKDVSTAERFYRWIAGVRMIKDNWLSGYGPGTFYYHYKPYAVPAFKTWVSDNKERSTVHNYFLLITIEQGIPGLLFFLLLAEAILYYSQRLYHQVQDTFYKTVALTAGVIFTMILVVNFLSDLVETDKVGSIFFLCLSVLVITDMNSRKILKPPPHIQSIS